ncbi:MAG: DUF805 domain-containing protein [Coriobacteriales bacterium]
MDWYLGVWKKYATFTGRARRKEYWMFFLFNMLASYILVFVDNALGLTNSQGNGPLSGIYSLAVLLPSLAVAVRRMHDTDHSGWWILVPIVNLVFAVMDGTPGPNRFGADPKATGAAGAAITPAGWYADPAGRHQLRYWDGARWTSSVSDGGAVSQDPV